METTENLGPSDTGVTRSARRTQSLFLRKHLVIALTLATASLLPLLFCSQSLRTLFFFGDDWDHLDQIQRQGLGSWIWTVFAENFVPLWKLLWGGVVLASNGSHFTLIVAVWITHALAVFFYCIVLLRAGLSALAVVLCAGCIGLSVTNIETLAWTTQWTTVLAAMFLLAGLLVVQLAHSNDHKSTWRQALLIFLLSACSAFSMVRGVITGPVMAAMVLWPMTNRRLPHSHDFALAAAALLPAVATALIILTQSRGNHHQIGGHLFDMARFAWYYFALNPLHRLVDFDSLGWRTTLIFGPLKILALSWCFRHARPPMRRLLAAMLLFNLAEAALLGLGRFHTGVAASVSSRYQYLSLITLAPFAGVIFDRVRTRASSRISAKVLLPSTILALLTIVWGVSHTWPEQLRSWSKFRGAKARDAVSRGATPDEVGAIPGIPYFKTERARELVDDLNLH